MGDGANISAGLRQAGLLADALRPVMLAHSETLKAQGQPFSQVQTVLITALMHELAAAIAQRRAVPEPGQ